jgi:TPP-dependent trihydroxycyclohexane-1,2-dione (THcHDO) dehydratase
MSTGMQTIRLTMARALVRHLAAQFIETGDGRERLRGDGFAKRLPDPTVQRVEHFGYSAMSVTDVFRSVSRYWERISHPAQLLQSLPAAIARLRDLPDCHPAFLALPQEVQGWANDYPLEFVAERVHRTDVISLQVDAFEDWTNDGHAWWEVGAPEVSGRAEVRQSHEAVELGRQHQRAGI